MEKKICNKCNLEKELNEFSFRNDTKKYKNSCKICMKSYGINYRVLNNDSIKTKKELYRNKEENKLKKSQYDKKYVKNLSSEKKEERLNNINKYNKNNVESFKKNQKKYRESENGRIKRKENRIKNREKRNLSDRQRKKIDHLFKLKHDIYNLVLSTFKKKKHKKTSKTVEILGCSIEFFKLYIESKFESWMTWENHGTYDKYNKTWQLDHIIPISSAKTEQEIVYLNNYTNFQPLESIKNILKSNNIEVI